MTAGCFISRNLHDLVKDVLADAGDDDAEDEAVEQFIEALPCVCQLRAAPGVGRRLYSRGERSQLVTRNAIT